MIAVLVLVELVVLVEPVVLVVLMGLAVLVVFCCDVCFLFATSCVMRCSTSSESVTCLLSKLCLFCALN